MFDIVLHLLLGFLVLFVCLGPIAILSWYIVKDIEASHKKEMGKDDFLDDDEYNDYNEDDEYADLYDDLDSDLALDEDEEVQAYIRRNRDRLL